MTEIIDLYDNARRFVRTIEHGAPVPDGLNRYSVHVWFVNSKNQILLQQRVHNGHKYADMWCHTGGGMQHGEDSWSTATRECVEEIGIAPDINNAVFIGTFHRAHKFVDVWMITQDFDLDTLHLQDAEVQSIQWADIKRLYEIHKMGLFMPTAWVGCKMMLKYMERVYGVNIDAEI